MICEAQLVNLSPRFNTAGKNAISTPESSEFLWFTPRPELNSVNHYNIPQ